MEKRKVIIGDYDTAAHGWTLNMCHLTPAEQKVNDVDKPGGDGTWDLSTTLTDGVPCYNDRTLTVRLECSDGTRLSREAVIDQMVNTLDGLRLDIKLPDDGLHYITGRVHVAKEYNDLVHAAVTVTAICNPWRYAKTETVVTAFAAGVEAECQLVNNGRRAVVPTLRVTGDIRPIELRYGDATISLTNGIHKWPELFLKTGTHTLTYGGYGDLTIMYREAVL